MMENSREQNIRNNIDAYIKGNLSEDEIQQLWAEFIKNPDLLDDLEIELSVRKIMEEKKGSFNRPTKISSFPKWTWHIAAAAVILIVAMIQFLRVDTPTAMEDFVVSEISPEHIETSDGIRAKDMSISTADSLLNLGFEAFVSGDETRALDLYNEVISKYPEEPYGSKAFLNKGIILYNEGDYEESISVFREAAERANEKQMIAEKAWWYLGNALVNVGNLEEARNAVYQAYIIDGIFRSPAFNLLVKLNHDLGRTDKEELDSSPQD